jgi:hypothetical protein
MDGDLLIVLGLWAPPLVYLVAQAASLRRWSGWWLGLALLPAAWFALWIVLFTISVVRDPTAHNLWPLELWVYSVAALGWLLLLAGLRKIAGMRGWSPSRPG